MYHIRKATNLLVLISSLFLAFNAFADNKTERVINGSTAPAGSWSWMVALLYSGATDTTEAHFCGGALIGPRVVLTAAHCALAFYPEEIEVMTGVNTLPFDKGNRVKINGYKVHPKFNSVTLENDFALIKLEKDLPGPYLSIASKADSALYQAGTAATILGWGTTDPKNPILPASLQQAEIPIWSDDTCLENLGRYFKPDTMLCAGKLESAPDAGDGVDACYGDSGGPLIVPDGTGAYKVYGVVSWGLQCTQKFYGVYSEVPAGEDFISTYPIIIPESLTPASIVGTPQVGTTLTCVPGTFIGDPVQSYTYNWYRDGELILSSSSPAYTLTVDDAYYYISCSADAINDGGTGTGIESYSVYVEDAPYPTPTPFVIQDLTAPTVQPLAFNCDDKLCTVLVSALDDQGANNVSSVSAIVERRTLSKCVRKSDNKTVSCTKAKVKSLIGRPLTPEVWSFEIKRNRGKKENFRVFFKASDYYGNESITLKALKKNFFTPRK